LLSVPLSHRRKEGLSHGYCKGSSACSPSQNRRPCVRRNTASSPCASALAQSAFGAGPAPLACNVYPSSDTAPANKEGAARIKNPNRLDWGRHTRTVAPFPRKDVSAPSRIGLLARGIALLSAPSQGRIP